MKRKLETIASTRAEKSQREVRKIKQNKPKKERGFEHKNIEDCN